jgi:hypothetical protein
LAVLFISVEMVVFRYESNHTLTLILTELCGGRGWSLGCGCVMSSNLPEQPISSRDIGRSVGPTAGISIEREKWD